MAHLRPGSADLAPGRFLDIHWGLIPPSRKRRGERMLLDEALRILASIPRRHDRLSIRSVPDRIQSRTIR